MRIVIYQNKTNLGEKIRLASPDLDTSLLLLQASFNDEFAGVRGTGPVDAAASPAAAVALHGRRAAGDERVALGVVEGAAIVVVVRIAGVGFVLILDSLIKS